MDDVDETGWEAPDHLWVLRHIRIDVVVPLVDDDRVELRTWCSGTAAVAAGRRMSIAGDRRGRVELDSVWVHLGPDARPAGLGPGSGLPCSMAPGSVELAPTIGLGAEGEPIARSATPKDGWPVD